VTEQFLSVLSMSGSMARHEVVVVVLGVYTMLLYSLPRQRQYDQEAMCCLLFHFIDAMRRMRQKQMTD